MNAETSTDPMLYQEALNLGRGHLLVFGLFHLEVALRALHDPNGPLVSQEYPTVEEWEASACKAWSDLRDTLRFAARYLEAAEWLHVLRTALDTAEAFIEYEKANRHVYGQPLPPGSVA